MDVLKYLFVVAIAVTILCFDKVQCNAIQRENACNSEGPVVHIKNQGFVRGRKANDALYYEYLGIRYGTVTRDNRFQGSLPGPTWEGIKDAYDDDLVCAQFDYRNPSSQRVVGIEDCLTLNVYTPTNITSYTKLAVMVYVHGGRFSAQSCCGKSTYGPKRFMAENIVLVNFSYRMNILGFLCNKDSANSGIKDVITVLKWIKDNIESFGGDPSKVTLFGHSSGAPMVQTVMLSKQSKGLISGAIAQSGSAVSPWYLAEHPEEKAYEVAKQLGYEGRNHSKMMSVLKNADIKDLVRAFANLPKKDTLEVLPITPCIENESNIDAIITTDPLNVINFGDYNDVPYIQGFVHNEGMTLYEDFQLNPDYLKTVDRYFSLTLPKDLQFPVAEHTHRIVQLVNQFYFDGKNISEASKNKAVEYIGDTQFVLPIIKSVRSLSKTNRTSPLYLYDFAYDGGMAFLKRALNFMDKPGVCHADELGYLWTQKGYSATKEDDEITAQRIVKLWTNFAKFGDPTPETSALLPVKWETAENLKYLTINSTLELKQYPFKERIDFWDRIYANLSSILQ